MRGKRYRWDDDVGRLVPYDDYGPAPRVHLLTDAPFDGLRATDGADISTRTKYEAYMRANKLTHMSDWRETWEKAAERRAAGAAADAPRRRAAIERVLRMPPQEVMRVAQRSKERAPAIAGRAIEQTYGQED